MGSAAGGLGDLWGSEDSYMFELTQEDERFRREVKEKLTEFERRLKALEEDDDGRH